MHGSKHFRWQERIFATEKELASKTTINDACEFFGVIVGGDEMPSIK
ncbi:hypothetical protein DP44_5196 [Burkholderia pseudomallei]|nr:hypothetical protein DP44_5196 [Burkholderia pseudomallei]